MKTTSFVRATVGFALIFLISSSLLQAAPRNRGTPSAAAESLKVLPGFKVELLRSSEQGGEGSWVGMAIDSKGRLIISPQNNERMLRITLDGDGKVAKTEQINLPVTGAMGLLCLNNSLYVNGQGKEGYHLYRLSDTDSDDQYDKVELIRRWNGGSGEHGAHGIVLGPDNKLYIICGNFVGVPNDILPTSPHKNYADDVVLPRAEDGNGFGAGKKPPGGYVVRMDLEGNNAELFASGQRNTYDIAFNTDGELFGFDSDMEWDWGMPWYRPIRAFHIVSGGDQGFREGTAKWPEYYEDSLPPVVNIGVGSPTGVKFGTGAKFPAKYQKAFYMMDWTYGRIVAVHLIPDGASYKGTFESFVSGKPLSVTDMEVGKDGALYFTTGGRGNPSGLYRVTYTGTESTAPVIETRTATTKADGARRTRHQLEAFHGKTNPEAVDAAWPHLNDPDRWLRYAARIAIESQPVSQWKDRALNENRSPEAGLTVLLALARLGGKESQPDLLNALKKWPTASLTEEQQLLKLRVIEVCFSRQGRPADEFVKLGIEKLDPLYPAKSAAVNRELCQILVYLQAPDVVKKTLALLAKADTLEEQITYVMALRKLKTGWTMDDHKAYLSWFNANAQIENRIARSTRHPAETVQWFKDAGRAYGDGSSFPKFINNMRSDAVASLTDDERGELAGLITSTTTPKPPPARTFKLVKEWTMADLTPDLERASVNRDYNKGKEAYAAAQCLACHKFGNEGGSVGPDLTAVSSRFGRTEVLSSIVEPSKVLSDQYQNIVVTTKDGEDVIGRLMEETDDKLVLCPNQLEPDKKVTIKKSDVSKRVASKTSPMPEGLVNILTKEEILDLLAYMESAGNKAHPAFKKN